MSSGYDHDGHRNDAGATRELVGRIRTTCSSAGNKSGNNLRAPQSHSTALQALQIWALA
jgi:hypothetical protein